MVITDYIITISASIIILIIKPHDTFKFHNVLLDINSIIKLIQMHNIASNYFFVIAKIITTKNLSKKLILKWFFLSKYESIKRTFMFLR